MADTALKLVLLGTDKSASSTLRGVQGEAEKTGGKLGKVGKVGKVAMLGIAGAALAAIPAVVDFAQGSLEAFADAEKSQKQLEDAYKRFPKVASVNIEKLREYNQALQRKTGADADDIASGQAVLARYKLTGNQLKTMTPLLVDYANRTGKSIPDAAKAMGKSLGGAGRLAKELGFSFKASKDPAENYRQTLEGLQSTVGGYTKQLPEAETKQKILAASFGDLQENIGEKLQPAMLGLIDAGQGVLDWAEQNPAVMEGATAGFALLGDAIQGIWSLIKAFLLPVLATAVSTFGMTVDAAASAAEALGLGDAAKKLRTTANGIQTVADGITALAKAPDPVVNPRVDDSQSKRKMSEIDAKIAKLNKQRIKLKSEGDTKGVKKVDDAIARLKRQRNTIKVGVGLTRSGPQTYRVDKRSGSGFLRYAASGTRYAPSGAMTWVGEAGPELMQLPTGSRVYSNGQSRAMANQAGASGSGGTTIIINAPPGVPLSFAKAVEAELVKLKQSRGRGGTLRF